MITSDRDDILRHGALEALLTKEEKRMAGKTKGTGMKKGSIKKKREWEDLQDSFAPVVKKSKKSVVDELLKERRKEARKERVEHKALIKKGKKSLKKKPKKKKG